MLLYSCFLLFIFIGYLSVELIRRKFFERIVVVRIDDEDGSSRLVSINVGRDKKVEDLLAEARKIKEHSLKTRGL